MSGLQLCEYFYPEYDATWEAAKLCGVERAVMRLPEEPSFDFTNEAHWETVVNRLNSCGLRPVVLEPLPNRLHDEIKRGGPNAEQCLEQAAEMLRVMDRFHIRCLCFNFMAGVGWTRTSRTIPERGNARVTGFDLDQFHEDTPVLTEQQLWQNYWHFLKSLLPYAEKYGVRLALHPDDPPVSPLGNTARIMTSYQNIRKAIDTIPSDFLGVTFCQACYWLMGEDLFQIIPELKEKIFFIHFRNVRGTRQHFQETFHDNGCLPMARLMELYYDLGLSVPIRPDHVPVYPGESEGIAGYTALGKHFALGYLKGLMEEAAVTIEKRG